MSMETQNIPSPHHSNAFRPSLVFPLGTAFLLIVVFTLSGIFSCWYHRGKLRSFRRRSHPADLEAPTNPAMQESSNRMVKESVPVLMPGDQVPKFIAMPCPCQPPHIGNDVVIVDMQKSYKLPPHVQVPVC